MTRARPALRGLAVVAGVAVALAAGAAREAAADDLALRGRVHVGDGTVLEDGVVLVRDGRIAAAGPAAAVDARGAREVAWPGAEVSPGLIDASSTVGLVDDEHGSEVIAHLRVLDALDLEAPGFARLARRGVTAVYVSGAGSAVLGARGALVRTAGRERVVLDAGAVKATLGPEAWQRGRPNRRPAGAPDFLTRRPTTRMGMVWVFREAFALAASPPADLPPGLEPEALAVLREVRSGRVALRVQARGRSDLETALRLAGELGVPIVLEEATEAHRVLDLLRRGPTRGSGAETAAPGPTPTPVVLGPLRDPASLGWRRGEVDDPCLGSPALLERAGIPFCLAAGDGASDVGTQAMLAVRYGLDPRAALRAVTSSAAAILGVAARLGSLAPGRDADVVVWSGPPLEPTSRPLLVVVQGEVVVGELPAAAAATPPGGGTERQRF